MIRLGVSSCLLYPDPKRPYFSTKTLAYLENDMANYLFARGQALPILIPPLAKEEQLKIYINEVDALVFQGGTDVCPESYNEPFLDQKAWPGDPQRDKYELALMDLAFKKGIPIYGICRGAQLINTYFGGTLYQDLPTQFPKALIHRNADLYDRIDHPVEFTPGGVLEKIYQNSKAPRQINTVHHQAVKTLGRNLTIEARSPEDNIIEAFRYAPENEKTDFRTVLAVQWHPEFSPTLGDRLLPPEPIIDYILEKAKA